LEDLGEDERTVLEWIVEKYGGKIHTGWSQDRDQWQVRIPYKVEISSLAERLLASQGLYYMELVGWLVS